MKRSLTVALASVFAALLPGGARPEGATKLLECSVARVCDAGGVCEPAQGHVVFRMESTDIEAGGAGRYVLSYGEVKAEMDAMSNSGPFVWTVGSQRHALIISSETQWLWHQLELDPMPGATVRFLVCSFEQ